MANKHQEDLEHIRTMMERSSRFISLSGMSGIIAGILALIASGFAYQFITENGIAYYKDRPALEPDAVTKLIITGLVTLAGALFSGIFFTVRKSKQDKIKIWTTITRRLLVSVAIPLLAGGIFCLALIYHREPGFVAPATLIFYGLALINAGKYTLNDVGYLGYCELILGLIAMFFIGYGLIFWAVGFGILHIIYGFLMYKKYP